MIRGRSKHGVCMGAALLSLLTPERGAAHMEDTPMAEHPPKTAAGVVSRGTTLAVNDDRFALSMAPFAKYAPASFFSFAAALPCGTFDGDALLSDAHLAAHVELVPALFLTKKLPPTHLYGLIGGRVADAGDEGESDGEHAINALGTRADREVFASAGASYFATSRFGIDARIQLFYEDFETLVPQPEGDVVFQHTEPESFTFKSSLSASYATAGVREGAGAGVSMYIAPDWQWAA